LISAAGNVLGGKLAKSRCKNRSPGFLPSPQIYDEYEGDLIIAMNPKINM